MQIGISSTKIFACKKVINYMNLAATVQKRPVSNEQALFWIVGLKGCGFSKHVTQPVVRSIEIAIAQDKGISKVEVLAWRDRLEELTKGLIWTVLYAHVRSFSIKLLIFGPQKSLRTKNLLHPPLD